MIHCDNSHSRYVDRITVLSSESKLFNVSLSVRNIFNFQLVQWATSVEYQPVHQNIRLFSLQMLYINA